MLEEIRAGRALKIVQLDGGGPGRGIERQIVRSGIAGNGRRDTRMGAVDGLHHAVEIVSAADIQRVRLRSHYQLKLARGRYGRRRLIRERCNEASVPVPLLVIRSTGVTLFTCSVVAPVLFAETLR